VEYAFALEQLPRIKGKSILDVGIGPNPALWYMLNTMGYECEGIDLKKRVAHRLAQVIDITTAWSFVPFDAVFCISTLEHIKEWTTAVANMAKVTKRGGVVVLTFPYSAKYIPNTVAGHYSQAFSPDEIVRMLATIGDKIVEKHYKVWTGPEWRMGERHPFPRLQGANGDLILLAVEKT